MSAGFDVDAFGDRGGELTKRCVVVSIYEDIGGRDLLFQVCDSLVSKFKDEVDFEVDWWRFKYLADPEIATEAAKKATQADLILLAARSSQLQLHVQGWFEGWLPNREAGDGALVLVQPSPHGASHSLHLRSYLRLTAQRAHLDYFSLSQPGPTDLPADEYRPMHWGINE